MQSMPQPLTRPHRKQREQAKDDGLAADNPKHVKPPQNIQAPQPLGRSHLLQFVIFGHGGNVSRLAKASKPSQNRVENSKNSIAHETQSL
jgi:hypothetical protein